MHAVHINNKYYNTFEKNALTKYLFTALVTLWDENTDFNFHISWNIVANMYFKEL